jgi:methionyl aminopeptidase
MNPSVLPFASNDPTLMREGMAFTIEPVLTLKPVREQDLELWPDGFSYICKETPKAQFEHTVLITPGGHEVLTRRPDEPDL